MKQEIEALLEHALMKYQSTNFDNVVDKNYWRGKVKALAQVLFLIKEEEDKQNDNSSDY